MADNMADNMAFSGATDAASNGSPPLQRLNDVDESTPDGAAEAAMEEGKVDTSSGVKEPHVSKYRRVAAEAVSTFFLVFMGCGAIVVDKKSHGAVTYLGVTLVWGLVIMAMIKAAGHISGAHMNPGITIAFASVGDFPVSLVPFYIAAQVGGSICAGYVLRLMFDPDLEDDLDHLGATHPVNSDGQAFAMEFLITLILMFVVCAVAVDSKAVGELAGLILGATITLNAIVGGAVSGASMNSARSIGPAVAANFYKSLWVYIFAPPLGAVAGAWLYTLLHGPHPLSSESQVRLKPDAQRAQKRLPIFRRGGSR